jgi:hypothetical protein
MERKKTEFLPLYSARLVFWFILLIPFAVFSQDKSLKGSGLSKQLAIDAAQYAKSSYTYSKMSHFLTNQALAQRNIDTAIYFIKWAISSLDSAILLAADSELLGIDYANLAKQNAKLSLRTLNSFAKYNMIADKQQLAEDATMLSAKVVVDAYHASFYLKDGRPSEKAKEEVVKKDSLPKQITKLDIDQALFTLLDVELVEKEEKNKKEILKLETQLKATKDPFKVGKIKAQIKKIELEEAEVEKNDKDAKEKLTEINEQLAEREKNKKMKTESTANAFSKSRPADNWDQQVLPESEIPMGLVYQVQIGVYKNPVTSETFKGITPIFSKTALTGITYSAGIFEKAADAKQAKDYVLGMGLHDAFVVVYNDRKRITMQEAAKLEKK